MTGKEERKFRNDARLWMMLLSGLVLLVLAVSACGGNGAATTEAVVVDPTEEPTEEATEALPPPPPDQSAYLAAWESGAHSTYSIEHGPNTWCSRCHSPQNWDPEAVVGPPPDCFTCKFPHEEEMRVAPGNAFVSEEEWVGISCDTCHMVDEAGTASAEIAWFNPISMEYTEVKTPTELCEKCHVSTAGNSLMASQSSAVDHKITLGGNAHLNYGGFLGESPPPQYCSDCHDPHSLEPAACEDCHADVVESAEHIKGKGFHLTKVTCMACHDAEGYDVGPHPDETVSTMWVTQETTTARGQTSTSAVISHSIVYKVSCDRCHFADNPNGLTHYDANGEIPSEEPEGGGPP